MQNEFTVLKSRGRRLLLLFFLDSRIIVILLDLDSRKIFLFFLDICIIVLLLDSRKFSSSFVTAEELLAAGPRGASPVSEPESIEEELSSVEAVDAVCCFSSSSTAE